jgi:hypothetical protein
VLAVSEVVTNATDVVTIKLVDVVLRVLGVHPVIVKTVKTNTQLPNNRNFL